MMKAALVLSADSASIRQQAGEINAMLNRMATTFTRLELWLFYRDIPPEIFPEIDCPLSAIRLIAVEYAHLPESYLQLLLDLMRQYPVDLFVFASDGLGAELATRLAYRLNGNSCLQVEDCKLASGKLEVIKPVYGNHLSARFILEHPPYCLSVAKQPCLPARMTSSELAKIEIITLNQPRTDCQKEILTIPDQPATGLTCADLVLVVGQGANSKETVDVLKGIANSMGAELGASRPVVMNAWTDMNRLIGTSGLIISPKLCIAAGVSGTGVFSVGIKSSEFIVAINTDSKAPIFQMADVGIVGDLLAILSELEKVITAEKAQKGLHHTRGSRIETQ
jgi:electron transfer flavoprotein alpha subunit